jgi:hypothetical protein
MEYEKCMCCGVEIPAGDTGLCLACEERLYYEPETTVEVRQ